MAINLSKVKLGYSPLTQRIYLYRHGVNPALALDKREAETDVMAVLVSRMTDESPGGSVLTFWFGDQEYELTLKPKDRGE